MNAPKLNKGQAAHTPGPWQVRVETAKKFDERTGEPYERTTTWVNSAGSDPVCLIHKATFRDQTEHDTNAQLIAAAPEMLEALEYMADFIKNNEELFGCFDGFGKRDQDNTRDFYNLPEIKAMVRAIAKATGGAE
jgi:hypothetical protein